MKILFVCTGNTCRSPMAEGIFNAYAQKEGWDAHADSAGISVTSAQPPSENAIVAAAEYGADIRGHQALRVNEEMVDTSDAVLCMTLGHQKVMERMFPQYAEKIFCLDKTDILDPYGGSLEVYQKTAAQIDEAIRKLPIRGEKA